MPCQVSYVPETRTVVVIGSGTVTAEEAAQANERTSLLVVENASTRVLADLSDAVGEVPTLDIHDLPRYSEVLAVPKNIRIAVVRPTAGYKAEDLRFYETVCRNRGYDCRLFTRRERALNWLEEGSLC